MIEQQHVNDDYDGSRQIRKQEGGPEDHVVKYLSVGDHLPADLLAISGTDVNDDQQEDAQNEGWDIGEDNVLENEVDKVEKFARSQRFPVDEASNEDDPEIGSDGEGHAADHADDAQHVVGVIDVAEHLGEGVEDLVDEQDGEDLHDGDGVVSPLQPEQGHQGYQKQHHSH